MLRSTLNKNLYRLLIVKYHGYIIKKQIEINRSLVKGRSDAGFKADRYGRKV
jgi:hypothetical protein